MVKFASPGLFVQESKTTTLDLTHMNPGETLGEWVVRCLIDHTGQHVLNDLTLANMRAYVEELVAVANYRGDLDIEEGVVLRHAVAIERDVAYRGYGVAEVHVNPGVRRRVVRIPMTLENDKLQDAALWFHPKELWVTLRARHPDTYAYSCPVKSTAAYRYGEDSWLIAGPYLLNGRWNPETALIDRLHNKPPLSLLMAVQEELRKHVASYQAPR